MTTLCAASGILNAQEFKLFNRTFQVHGFATQGFVKTDQNNWLTMNTSGGGSGEFSDFGFNVSTQLTDKLRIGAQFYDRNLGKLGKYQPTLDWAYASYQFKPWFGIRGGKVKTTFGLFNDTQDLDFVHPFALLPQSVYTIDLRDATIAHTGGDVFGDIKLGNKGGTLSYTVFAGNNEHGGSGGYAYLLQAVGGIKLRALGGLQYGADLRWKTPLKGLVVGASRMNQDTTGRGTYSFAIPGLPLVAMPYSETTKSDWTNQFYGSYSIGNLEVNAEYRRYWRDQITYNSTFRDTADTRGWYISGAYRLNKWLQLGSYYSHYRDDGLMYTYPDGVYTYALGGHNYDKVVSARFDVNRYLDFKVEGHFMDGTSAGFYPQGFYPQVNPQGITPNTNALVVKTGFNF